MIDQKFSAQLQHANEWMNGDFRFVWGLDYFLTMPDTEEQFYQIKTL